MGEKMKRLALFVVMSALSSQAAAGFYKCEDDRGRPVFSDKPCGADAQEIELKSNDNGGINMGSAGDYSSVYKSGRSRDLKRKIKLKRDEISSIEDQKDMALARLRIDQMYSANNLAGAVRDESLATEMEAVVKDYNARISIRVRELEALIAQLNNQ